MKTIQTGEIRLKRVNDEWRWSQTLRAERTKGDSEVKLIFPAGPKTKRTICAFVDEEELIRLAQWMRGEVR